MSCEKVLSHTNLFSHLFIPPFNKHAMDSLFQLLDCIFIYTQAFQVCCLESYNSISFSYLEGARMNLLSISSSTKMSLVPSKPSHCFPLSESPLLHILHVFSSQQTSLEAAHIPMRAGPASSSRKHSNDRSLWRIIFKHLLSLGTNSNKKNDSHGLRIYYTPATV